MMSTRCSRLGAWFLSAVGGGIASGAAGNAADFGTSVHLGCDYQLVGEITDDIAIRLDGLRGGYDGVVLCLDSPGGSLIGGMELFQLVAARNIITRIPAGWRCESICAPVFMAGSVQTGLGRSITYRSNQLEPGGILGFHAPALILPDHGSYPPEIVATAFNAAIQAASTLYRASLREEDEWRSFNEYLFARMLETPHDQMYRIETVADAVLSDIHLGVMAIPTDITEDHVANLCDNAFLSQAGLRLRMPQGGALSAYAALRHTSPDSTDAWEAEYRYVKLEPGPERSVRGYVSGYDLQYFGSGPVGVACMAEITMPDKGRYPDFEEEGQFVTGWYLDPNVTFYTYTIMSFDEDEAESWHLPMEQERITARVSAPLWMLNAPNARLDSLVPVFE